MSMLLIGALAVVTRVRQSMARPPREAKPKTKQQKESVRYEKSERKDQPVPEKPEENNEDDDPEEYTAVNVELDHGIEEEPGEEYQVLPDEGEVNYVIDESVA